MNASCKYCGTTDLAWMKTVDGPRLFDKFGQMHYMCQGLKDFIKAKGSAGGQGAEFYSESELMAPVGIKLDPPPVPQVDSPWMDKLNEVGNKASQAIDLDISTSASFGELGNRVNGLNSEFNKLDAKWEAKLNESKTIEIKHQDGMIVNVGRQHREFPKLVRLVTSKAIYF